MIFKQQQFAQLAITVLGNQAGLYNLGVVKHYYVAGLKVIGQILVHAVFYCAVGTVQNQQPAGAAYFWRVLGYQFFRKGIAKIRNFHLGMIA